MPNVNIKCVLLFYLLYCLSFIVTTTCQLSHNGTTLKNWFSQFNDEIFSHEQVKKKKKKNSPIFGCSFDKQKKKATFECVRRKLLKCSGKLFNAWSDDLSIIHPNEKLKREQIHNEAEHYIVTKKGINEKLNYIDLSSFSTYCSFYKLYVRDLVHFSGNKGAYNGSSFIPKTIIKRYFVKTDHLNSDPLDENIYIFISGTKKGSLKGENENPPYSKIYYTVGSIIHNYYVFFISKILDHTFYFVFSEGHKKGSATHRTSNSYLIYKNEVIYPFRKGERVCGGVPFQDYSHYDDLRDFYVIEICHCFNGITYRQNLHRLLKRLCRLYFNIELVPYILHLPPVFYHILIILICSLMFAYISYKIFLKYKNCF
ncbi:hypothetical protein C922_01091 [Plasmodium inui San Antonio 1]|uniref:Uncharacterized protein n=1 Tax=Plasmodium inui San Antonio 1 TaxID=1237626 RepID=W7ATC1_9APIC|nr:hypothetical protein C922_01091 [Plasmodium inui San Antonio 1]EUD68691.1 hypothetical protein C922_01091 [Plasmodium inui San Antonio 1]